jgi:hypothetical protein
MAGLRTTGEAFAGEVISADPARTVPGAKGRPKLRPEFTVLTEDPVRISAEKTLVCPGRPKLKAKITGMARSGGQTEVTLEVTGGMGTFAKPAPDAVPAIGEQVSCTTDPGYWAAPQFPPADQTPWTHGGPPLPPHHLQRQRPA